MASIGEVHAPERIQSFVFTRELAEVYLLLDHLSGRSDKSLAIAFGDGAEKIGEEWIKQICEIAWPPKGTSTEQAAQAAALLRARDRLNAAAKPANGHSIAFTLLVVGDDSIAPAPKVAPTTPEGGSSSPNSDGDSASPPFAGIWGDKPPSRISLAKLAYPGLVGKAACFRRGTQVIIGLLLFWLVVTCILSWNIAAGQAIVARLDAGQTARTAIVNRIADEIKASDNMAVRCDWPAPSETPKVPADDLTATRRRILDDFNDNCRNYRDNRDNLAGWLFPWRWLRRLPAEEINEQWAAVLIQVLATGVLPIFYGLLGAGVAVIRNNSSKMRDRLLSSRDPALSLGQMAQGAVIGACIGLFVTPSGVGSLVTLTPSALSFIAGFGVESVFVMLEGLIKRVFNIPGQTP